MASALHCSYRSPHRLADVLWPSVGKSSALPMYAQWSWMLRALAWTVEVSNFAGASRGAGSAVLHGPGKRISSFHNHSVALFFPMFPRIYWAWKIACRRHVNHQHFVFILGIQKRPEKKRFYKNTNRTFRPHGLPQQQQPRKPLPQQQKPRKPLRAKRPVCILIKSFFSGLFWMPMMI